MCRPRRWWNFGCRRGGHRGVRLGWSCDFNHEPEEAPMTEDRLAADRAAAEEPDDGDFLRAVAEAVLQLLMEADVEGADRRRPARARRRSADLAQRLPRPRRSTRGSASLQPADPEAAAGQLLPAASWSRARRRRRRWSRSSRRPGSAASRPAGSTSWCRRWGSPASRRATVSKLCKDIDERVRAFLDRPLDGDWPYLWLDATYLKVREGGRIVSVAAIIAVAVNTDGRREIVGLASARRRPRPSGRTS